MTPPPNREDDDVLPVRRIVSHHSHEIPNYFGKCPKCGYTARATAIGVVFDNGESASAVIAGCDLPCGW